MTFYPGYFCIRDFFCPLSYLIEALLLLIFNMDSKRYNNTKLFMGIFKGVMFFILLFLFVHSGYSAQLDRYLSIYFENGYIRFLLFIFIAGTLSGIIFSPVNFYSQYYLEHKYNLSNQTIYLWFWESAKGLGISLVIGVPVLLLFYYSILTYGNYWWLPFAIILFFISVVLARIAPVLILPIFYKIIPLDDDDLKARISNLAKDAGLRIENVYKFNMSKNTKKANAAFTGIGKSKRIILGDTLVENYSKDEIETVIAHEMGHYKQKHILKNILFSTASSFITFYLIAKLYELSYRWFGFESITEIAAIPLLSLWGMLIAIILTPLGNMLSRKYEYEADEYAINVTNKPGAFISTLEKLTEQNLGDKEPHPFVEWFFYSHPSIVKRINFIKAMIDSPIKKTAEAN